MFEQRPLLLGQDLAKGRRPRPSSDVVDLILSDLNRRTCRPRCRTSATRSEATGWERPDGVSRPRPLVGCDGVPPPCSLSSGVSKDPADPSVDPCRGRRPRSHDAADVGPWSSTATWTEGACFSVAPSRSFVTSSPRPVTPATVPHGPSSTMAAAGGRLLTVAAATGPAPRSEMTAIRRVPARRAPKPRHGNGVPLLPEHYVRRRPLRLLDDVTAAPFTLVVARPAPARHRSGRLDGRARRRRRGCRSTRRTGTPASSGPASSRPSAPWCPGTARR